MNNNSNDPRWTDWKWQHSKSCQDWETLERWFKASNAPLPFDATDLHALTSIYRMGITPYYFNLISNFIDADPIYRQIIPHIHELKISDDELDDPIADDNPARGSRPLKALIHRYPNRVLLLPTAQCAVYCRFCFRKRLVGDTSHNPREEDLQAAYKYIESHTDIEEVILTGGDPLTLGDRALEKILQRLDGIKHLRMIRIHSRLPVVNPFRLTDTLGSMLAALSKPVWVSAHFNHSSEITATARQYIQGWVTKGIPFLNQSVLLRGVNDSPAALKDLFMSLIEIKVKPYYLHQTDMVRGTGHLRVSVEEGLLILKQLQGEVPGYALPHYVLDRSNGLGKIPLQNIYI